MAAEKKLDEPITEDVVEAVPNKAPIGKAFKKDAKLITDALAKLALSDLNELEGKLENNETYELAVNDQKYTLSKEMVSVKKYQKTVHVKEIIPSVIEPSFGIGRVMYAIFEHNFKIRDNDEQRTYLALPAVIAPLKCSVLPLSGNVEFVPFIKKLCINAF